MLTVDFDRLGLRPGDRVLDMGCGAGRHAFEMYRRGADVIAFDQDADELVTALRALLDDPERRARYGAAGRRRVEELFSWQAAAAATAKVYAEAIADHAARPTPSQGRRARAHR